MVSPLNSHAVHGGTGRGGTADKGAQAGMARTKKDVVTEFRTGEIIQAANRVFAERGFDQATMDEIAREAGVAKGTLYLYYPSKQDIYWAALRRGALELAAQTAEAVAAAAGAEEKVRAFIAARLRYFEQHRDLFRIVDSEFGRSFCRHDPPAKEFEELFLEQVKALDHLLQQAVRRKAIRAVRTEAVAFALFDITRGLATQRLRAGSRAPIEDDIAFAFDLTWKGMGHR
jgi:AcrR family transcriptional regulator